jgi:hypothetical protein
VSAREYPNGRRAVTLRPTARRIELQAWHTFTAETFAEHKAVLSVVADSVPVVENGKRELFTALTVRLLAALRAKDRQFEEVVQEARAATVLLLVY